MFTPPHRSLAYIVNGLIVISLIVGGLAPVQMAQAAEAGKAAAGPALSRNPEQREEIARNTAAIVKSSSSPMPTGTTCRRAAILSTATITMTSIFTTTPSI